MTYHSTPAPAQGLDVGVAARTARLVVAVIAGAATLAGCGGGGTAEPEPTLGPTTPATSAVVPAGPGIFADVRADVDRTFASSDVFAAANAIVPVFEDLPSADGASLVGWSVSAFEQEVAAEALEGKLRYFLHLDYVTPANRSEVEALYRDAVPALGYEVRSVSEGVRDDGTDVTRLSFEALGQAHPSGDRTNAMIAVTAVEFDDTTTLIEFEASFWHHDAALPDRLAAIADAVPAPAGTRTTGVAYRAFLDGGDAGGSAIVEISTAHHRDVEPGDRSGDLMAAYYGEFPFAGWSAPTSPEQGTTTPSIGIIHDASGNDHGTATLVIVEQGATFTIELRERISR